MPKLIVIDRHGNKHNIEADESYTLMEILRDNNFDIEAACGGCCACATCHVYVNQNWIDKLKPMDDDEESMLDQAFSLKPNSRLGCQIEYTNKIDGICLKLAPE